MASKWEMRLTIYDNESEYDSVNQIAHTTLHTMRKHIYGNELVGDVFHVYKRINIV